MDLVRPLQMAQSGNLPSYGDLLKKAKRELPEPTSSGERWEIPKVELMTEGRTTVIRNMDFILEKVRREPSHLTTYLLREIGTAGDFENGRLTRSEERR